MPEFILTHRIQLVANVARWHQIICKWVAELLINSLISICFIYIIWPVLAYWAAGEFLFFTITSQKEFEPHCVSVCVCAAVLSCVDGLCSSYQRAENVQLVSSCINFKSMCCVTHAFFLFPDSWNVSLFPTELKIQMTCSFNSICFLIMMWGNKSSHYRQAYHICSRVSASQWCV